jgi:formylglycine-generating enzyme required for sulfatase activity
MLTYVPLNMLFALVPGGAFEMGISPQDLDEAQDYVDWTKSAADTAAAYRACATPVHTVSVAPFLCSVEPLEAGQLERLSGKTLEEGSFEVGPVRAAIESLGFRLPSEVELEWLAREGGCHRSVLDIGPRYAQDGEASERALHRFAMNGMVYSQWADDDWHPNYQGAPCDSKPWRDGDPIGVVRGGIYLEMITSTEGLLNGLAGRRRSGAELRDDGFLVMRLARDLPPNVG